MGRDGTGRDHGSILTMVLPSRPVVTVNTVPSIKHEKPCEINLDFSPVRMLMMWLLRTSYIPGSYNTMQASSMSVITKKQSTKNSICMNHTKTQKNLYPLIFSGTVLYCTAVQAQKKRSFDVSFRPKTCSWRAFFILRFNIMYIPVFGSMSTTGIPVFGTFPIVNNTWYNTCLSGSPGFRLKFGYR